MFKKHTVGLALAVLAMGFAARAAIQATPSPTVQQSGAQAAVARCTFSIDLQSPRPNAMYSAPASIPLTAQVLYYQDGCNPGNVSFYNGTTLLATVPNDGSDHYQSVWTNVGPGTYTVKAVMRGFSSQATITVGQANTPPTVSLAAPSGGPFVAPQSVYLSATASDPDGPVSKVEFYQGANLVGTAYSAPYTASFYATVPGTFSFTAIAYDAQTSTTSGAVTATVAANQAPTLAVTSPAPNASFGTPTTITINANASDADGSVNRVDFSSDTGWSTSVSAPPYAAAWPTGDIGGNHTITVAAYDNKGTPSSVVVPVALVSATGSVAASPNPCTLSGTTCATTITWSSSTATAQLWEIYDRLGYTYQAQVGSGTYGTYNATVGANRTNQHYDVRVGSRVVASVNVTANAAPTIALTTPSTPSSALAPAAITLAATASDSDGSIAKVEFWNGGTKLGEDTTAPYTWPLSGLGVGSYSFSARAIDNQGAATSTAAVAYTVHNPPSVTLTAPANGSVIVSPASITLAANASDDNGIARVEFYNGATKIGESSSAPYTFAWTGVTSGTYDVSARAVDILGAMTTSGTARVVVSAAPTVSLTAPIAGAILNAPAQFYLAANAADSDGTVTNVEFYANGSKIGEDTTAPFDFTWANVPRGNYSLVAKAYDNVGLVTSSSAISVIANGIPTIAVTSPAAGSFVNAPGSVLVQTSASDPDDGVAIVEFYVNGSKLATDTAAPFTLQMDNLPAGNYSVVARAYDNRGAAVDSAPVVFVVNALPTVSLVSPADNAGIVAPSTITVAANAADSDGSISKVEFYNGSTLLGTATGAPYSINWSVPANGDYVVTARAYDNRGATSEASSHLRARGSAFDLLQDAPRTDLSSELPTHDPTVGKLAGTAATSGGSASYEIPIIVPPGRRGMQPDLGLAYSSRGGNGVAGMGWSLSGLSAIQRCPATLVQDGAVRAVQLDGADKLCLDGQRLLATSGTYGQAGATYDTEIDSFARVTQLGGALDSAAVYFKVERKSGEIAWYGNGANTQVIPGGKAVALSWLINRVDDRVGNFMEYIYNNAGNGELLIDTIRYTGFGSTPGDRKVQFVYEARPTGTGANDMSSSYIAGGMILQTQRLKAVVASVGTEYTRELLLEYDGVSTTTGRSLLVRAYDCAYSGSWTCRPPTRFDWQQGASTYRLTAPSFGFDQTTGTNERIRSAGDFDGDGTAEVLLDRRTPSGALDTYIVSLAPDRAVRWSVLVPPDFLGFQLDRLQDFNQDGRVDIVGRDINGNVTVRFWTGDGADFNTSFGRTWNTGVQVPLFGAELAYVGDMDGDGRADLVVTRDNPSGGASCNRVVSVYRNTPTTSDAITAPTFPVVAQHCLAGQYIANYWDNESVRRVSDFDGDGLPDLWINSVGTQHRFDRIVFGARSPNYSFVAKPFQNLFTAAQPADAQELRSDVFAQWVDVNGDGLDDFVYARSETVGKWAVRLNRGGFLGTRYVFARNDGIARCDHYNSPNTCDQVWSPWLAKNISAADIDGDGRTEILVPRRMAATVCVKFAPNPQTCPNGDGTDPSCYERYACPEDPVTGNGMFGAKAYFGGDLYFVEASHYKPGYYDDSSYFMGALRFVETGPNTAELRLIDTDIVSGGDVVAEDLYGDGHIDLITNVGSSRVNPGALARPEADKNGVPFSSDVAPVALPNGIPLMTQNALVNENLGPGARTNPDGRTPQTQDMLAMATDGLGVQTLWTYYPLSSSAGRSANETPLYSVPTDTASRYIDERHIYFRSSMPVVSSMIQSDGVSDFRSWHYGYREAMYNTQGRGFQGFHTVIEEDDGSGLRTTTTFHQKYPLTSQPEQIVVNPIGRPGTSGAISVTNFAWRCNRANRGDTTACANAATGVPVFPFLDTKESWTYDAATAVAGGTPQAISLTQEVNADDAACTGSYSTSSGYDAYGNLLRKTVHVKDVGSGGGGYRTFLSDQCQREASSFTADTGAWWLDRLDSRVVTSQVTWDSAIHALPTGASAPASTVTTDYLWNGDRTLSREVVQAGLAGQQRITQYGYPASGNYGLPNSASVTAADDANGTRTTGTAYSPDGYFVLAVANPLGHTATTSVRLRDGLPLSVTDANGLRTLTDYDAFGFPVRVRYRGRTDAEYVAPDRLAAMTRCGADGCGTTGAAYQLVTVQDGAPTQLTRFDMLGRPRLKAEKQMDGQWTNVYTEYNARGLVARQSEPARAGDTVYWSRFPTYDVLGRPTQKIVPQQGEDGRGDRVTNYIYSGRQTAIQVCGTADSGSSNCLNLSRTTDAAGRYVETIDALGGRTRFWYGATGGTVALEDAKGSVISAQYNAIGQRTRVDDPNQGGWTFKYDALGELLSQTDARNIVTTFKYDALGRPKERRATVEVTGDATPDDLFDQWSYDPANALGAEASSQRTINGTLERSTGSTYDGLARPVQQDVVQALTVGTGNYRLRTSYDTYYGRPLGREFPNGETVAFGYTRYGQALNESDPATGTVYRVLGSTNARGQPTLETFGGTLQTVPTYAPTTGQVTELVQQSNGTAVRRLGYGYDLYGNVVRQTLNAGQTEENYQYDALQRLTQTTRTGAATGTTGYGYDAVGNFTYKSDFSTSTVGAYGYTGGGCGGGPNAVKSVQLPSGTRTYCYDANGNLTSDSAGLSIAYDNLNLPVVARRGAAQDMFRYGPDGQRVRSSGADGSRVYLPGYEHRTDTGETKVYVADYAVITRSGSTRKVEYLLKDRLGSVDVVANSSGAVTETRGYDAFGKPRSGTWADLSPARLQSTTTTSKGFTQHEHLDQLDLIHMNGRVYDYNVGRFTGVDPLVFEPLNSQSINPYNYLFNNPLAGTDPTGYSPCEAGKTDDCTDVQVERDRTPATGTHIPTNINVSGQLSSNGVTARINVTLTKDGNFVSGSITPVSGASRETSRGTAAIGSADRRENVAGSAGQAGAGIGATAGRIASHVGEAAEAEGAVASSVVGSAVIGVWAALHSEPLGVGEKTSRRDLTNISMDNAWAAGIAQAAKQSNRGNAALIGEEQQERVVPQAQIMRRAGVPVETIIYTGQYTYGHPLSTGEKIASMVYNAGWITSVMQRGMYIYDIRRDPYRVRTGQPISEWYGLELALIRSSGYPRYSPIQSSVDYGR